MKYERIAGDLTIPIIAESLRMGQNRGPDMRSLIAPGPQAIKWESRRMAADFGPKKISGWEKELGLGIDRGRRPK